MTLQEAIEASAPGTIPRTPFYAEFEGDQVLVRCVLERTAVYERAGERGVAVFARFEPVGELEWFQTADGAAARRERGRAMTLSRREVCQGTENPWCGKSTGYATHRCRGEACAAARRALRANEAGRRG